MLWRSWIYILFCCSMPHSCTDSPAVFFRLPLATAGFLMCFSCPADHWPVRGFDVATALLQVKFHTLMRIHEPWFGIDKCSILSSGNQLCGTTPIRWFVNTQPGWFLSYLCCAYCFQASDGGRRCSTCWLVPAGCYYRWQLVFNIYRFSTKRLNNVLVKLSEISLQCWISTHLLPSIW